MNLSDYINLTLTEIVEGVKKANKPYAKKDKELVLSETALRLLIGMTTAKRHISQ